MLLPYFPPLDTMRHPDMSQQKGTAADDDINDGSVAFRCAGDPAGTIVGQQPLLCDSLHYLLKCLRCKRCPMYQDYVTVVRRTFPS